ncbi:MAG: transglycosylase SLT domain-containing protein [Bacteroidetes bacterium]|nr:transglycosylase SLT domain-containing protein [Bacteroidota bacterium]
MYKILIIAMFAVPMAIFGCLDNNFSRLNGQQALIQDEQKENLDTRSLAILNQYGRTIKNYSTQYGIDWRLVVAVMKQESQFDHSAESYKGAAGLMQIMPATQAIIAKEIGIKQTAFNDPRENIRGGIYYLAKLYRQFDKQGISEENKIKFSLAAYNAGINRVIDAQKMASYVNDDPREWNSVKNSLSLLSKRYSSLHKFVWEEKKPAAGYFRDWRQTSNYVESVMEYYKKYKIVLNNQA